MFKPNEYFWKTHYDPKCGLQEWEFYAKIVREEIMAKSFNFKLSTVALKDKFTF